MSLESGEMPRPRTILCEKSGLVRGARATSSTYCKVRLRAWPAADLVSTGPSRASLRSYEKSGLVARHGAGCVKIKCH
jgi:hypothetical protein